MRSKIVIPSSGIIELMDDVDISLTYQVADIKDPQKRHSDFSKTIQVPGTHNNNKMFQHIFEIGMDRWYDPNKKAKCYLMIDTQIVMNGYLRLRNIVKTDDKISYDCEITGRTADLFLSIGETYVKDLPWSDLDHTYNQANQIASWSAPIGSNYVYPFIDYGKTLNAYTYKVDDFYPATYIKEIWDRIFMYHGFQYTSQSNFFTSTRFKSLIMPFNSDSLRLTAQQIADNTFRASVETTSQSIPVPAGINYTDIIFNDDTTSPNVDSNNVYNPATGVYTVNDAGYYKITGVLNISATANVTTPVTNSQILVYTSVRLIDGGNNIGNISNLCLHIISGGASGVQSAPAQLHNITLANNVYLTAGTTLKLQLKHEYQLLGGPQISSASAEVQVGSYWFNTIDPIIQDGQNLTFANTIDQKLKCKDFVKAIIKMFNLYVEYDKDIPNKLIIDPRDSYYTTTIQDWSQKRDLSKDLEITPMGALQAKTYLFTYKEDKDWLNELYVKSHSQIYGQKLLDIDNDFLTNTQKEEIVFSPSPLDSSNAMATSVPVVSSDDRYFVCMFKNDNGQKVAYAANPRVLYYGGVRGCKPWNYRSDLLQSTSGVTNYPYAGHLDDPITPTFDLNWNMPIEVYYDPASYATYTNNNLYNIYWSNEMSEITDKNSSIVTGWFRLHPKDIALLDFRHVYHFDRQNFRLNKVYDYNPLKEGLTKCEFVKIKTGIPFASSTGFLNGANASLLNIPLPIPRPKKRPSGVPIGQGGISSNRIILGDGNQVPESSEGVFISGRYNIVGENARNITLINSSGCIVPGDVSEVYVMNSSGVTVTESNTLVLNNVVMSGSAPCGTFVPVVTSKTNIANFEILKWHWVRNGLSITMTGRFNIDSDTAGVDTSFRMSIPFESDFTNSYLSGMGVSNNSGDVYTPSVVGGETGLIELKVVTASSTTLETYHFTITYYIE